MKKILAAAAIVGLFASMSYALPVTPPGGGVRGSVHDMNNLGAAGIGTIAPDAQGRVCAFCHTPHHALSDVNYDYAPLWSHEFSALIPGSGYTSYETATFDGSRSGAFDPLIGPSRLCMSCHDGVVAPDTHYGFVPGNAPTGLLLSDSWDGKAIGNAAGNGTAGYFSNDHPIGFDVLQVISTGAFPDPDIYDAITVDKTWDGYNGTKVGLTVRAGLYDPAKDGSTLYMTCATCHEVHNKDNSTNAGPDWDGDGQGEHVDTVRGNYLVFSPQSGSQLCLTCHIK